MLKILPQRTVNNHSILSCRGLSLKVGRGTQGRGDVGTWDAGTRGRGDAETWEREDFGNRRRAGKGKEEP